MRQMAEIALAEVLVDDHVEGKCSCHFTTSLCEGCLNAFRSEIVRRGVGTPWCQMRGGCHAIFMSTLGTIR